MRTFILSVFPDTYLLSLQVSNNTTETSGLQQLNDFPAPFQLIPLTTAGKKKISTYTGQWYYPLFIKNQEC